MDYTAMQRQAIETIDRNLQIIACAGSGKTQVILARIAHILQQGCRRRPLPSPSRRRPPAS